MTTVDVLDFVTNTHAEVGTGAVLLDINDGTDFCLDEIEFPIPKPNYEWRDPAHGQGRDVSYYKYQNREITLHMNVFGATENDLSTNFRALLDLLNGEEPILEWWPAGWTDPLYFDLISPPLEINTPDWFETWIRTNKQMHVLSNVEIKVEAKPFARAKEETVVLGNDLSVSKIVKSPASFKGDVPAPADIYVDLASGDRWTDLIIGQRLKYSASFDPVQEPITGANQADADRLGDDYQIIDAPVDLLAAVDGSFEEYAGSGDTTDWDHWDETRSFTTNPYCGVQLSAVGGGGYGGSDCAQVMADNDAELCLNGGFEANDAVAYPNTNFTDWVESGNRGLAAGHSGTYSAQLGLGAYLESSAYIPIDPNEVYRLTIWGITGGQFDLECRCYTAAPVYISSVITHITLGGGWNSYGGDILTWPAGTTQVKIRLTETGGVGVIFDDVSFYQRTYTLDESLISSAAIPVSSASTYMVSFYGKRWWWGDGAALINTKLTVHFYDGGVATGTKVIYDGNLNYPDWKQFSGVIYPTDFPTVGTDQIKLEFSRVGHDWIEGWSTYKIPVHYLDMVSVYELTDVEAVYNLDSHEGRYIPTASISFSDTNPYDDVTLDNRLATTGGVTITDLTAPQTVDTGDPNTKFVDLSMLPDRPSVITIPSHKVSGLADKTLIDQIVRVTTESGNAEELWCDYIAIVPEDRAYSEVRDWVGSDHLILDGRSSNLALLSVTGTLDDAMIYDMSNQKGECSFVADPDGFNGTIIVLVNASDTASPPNPTGDYSVTSLVDVTMKYQPYFLLVPES